MSSHTHTHSWNHTQPHTRTNQLRRCPDAVRSPQHFTHSIPSGPVWSKSKMDKNKKKLGVPYPLWPRFLSCCLPCSLLPSPLGFFLSRLVSSPTSLHIFVHTSPLLSSRLLFWSRQIDLANPTLRGLLALGCLVVPSRLDLSPRGLRPFILWLFP